jgi:hypothetical protein
VFSGGHGGQADDRIVAQSGNGFQCHVTGASTWRLSMLPKTAAQRAEVDRQEATARALTGEVRRAKEPSLGSTSRPWSVGADRS